MNTILEQLREARAAFDQAHRTHEDAAAAYLDLKRRIGSNEAERKAQKATTPEAEYASCVALMPQVEDDKLAAAAHLERTEKTLNVLREELQHETATINRAWAEIADTTAQRYAMLAMAPPARPIVLRQYVSEPDF